MLESEAKEKWCPFARVPGDNVGDGSCNRNSYGGDRRCDDAKPISPCIGSACMAWRKTGNAKFKDAQTGQLSDQDLSGHGEWIYDGYCGLSGPTKEEASVQKIFDDMRICTDDHH